MQINSSLPSILFRLNKKMISFLLILPLFHIGFDDINKLYMDYFSHATLVRTHGEIFTLFMQWDYIYPKVIHTQFLIFLCINHDHG